jgi:hypothetical protein
MVRLANCAISLAVAWGAATQAEADTLTGEYDGDLSDEDLAAIAEAESIEIFDERPDKPFDRNRCTNPLLV